MVRPCPGISAGFYQGVAEAIAQGPVDDPAALEAVRVMACLEAALTSARTRGAVGLPLAPDERGA